MAWLEFTALGLVLLGWLDGCASTCEIQKLRARVASLEARPTLATPDAGAWGDGTSVGAPLTASHPAARPRSCRT